MIILKSLVRTLPSLFTDTLSRLRTVTATSTAPETRVGSTDVTSRVSLPH
jgi:hypothetical protein